MLQDVDKRSVSKSVLSGAGWKIPDHDEDTDDSTAYGITPSACLFLYILIWLICM